MHGDSQKDGIYVCIHPFVYPPTHHPSIVTHFYIQEGNIQFPHPLRRSQGSPALFDPLSVHLTHLLLSCWCSSTCGPHPPSMQLPQWAVRATTLNTALLFPFLQQFPCTLGEDDSQGPATQWCQSYPEASSMPSFSVLPSTPDLPCSHLGSRILCFQCLTPTLASSSA